jgi:hypothetical protein
MQQFNQPDDENCHICSECLFKAPTEALLQKHMQKVIIFYIFLQLLNLKTLIM